MKYIFSDFDGTLTNEAGLLTPAFHDLLTLIKKQKKTLVIVTGRSASWGHFFLSHFEIDYVVAESGGVIIYRKDNIIKTKCLSNLDKIQKMEKILKKKFPSLVWGEDNVGRLTDRSLEFESFKGVKGKKTLVKLKDFFLKAGVYYTVSSIHLNFQMSKNQSKWSGTQFLVNKIWKIPLSILDNDSMFFGDSLNDEIMFKMMKLTFGVSNIKNCLADLKYPPKTILKLPGILGPLNYLMKKD